MKKYIKTRIVKKIGKKIILDYNFKKFININLKEFKKSYKKIKKNKIIYLKKKDDNFSLIEYSVENSFKKLKRKTSISGRIKKKVKGGYLVECKNIKCFLPGSMMDKKLITIFKRKNKIKFKIIKIDYKNLNVVISKKKNIKKKKKSNYFKINRIIKGRVKEKKKWGFIISNIKANCFLHYENILKKNKDIKNKIEKDFLVKKIKNEKIYLVLRKFTKNEIKFKKSINKGYIVSSLKKYGKINYFFKLSKYIGLLNKKDISWINYNNYVSTKKNRKIKIKNFFYNERAILLNCNLNILNPFILIYNYYLGKKINVKFYKNNKYFSIFKLPFLSVGISKKGKYKKKKYIMYVKYVDYINKITFISKL
ncbi:hypothetical protein [Candidatus Vidania fulgoroideorum]